eukprot:10059234-Alexandrium_andersonii.AAC.1
MSASLVGSEMCIRDRSRSLPDCETTKTRTAVGAVADMAPMPAGRIVPGRLARPPKEILEPASWGSFEPARVDHVAPE